MASVHPLLGPTGPGDPSALHGRAADVRGFTGAARPRMVPDAAALDRLIHERTRLGIVSALAGDASLSFTDLRDRLGTSDGNLGVHARKLEGAGYVACAKSFAGRVPKTEYRLTDEGRAALARYLDHMDALIRATRDR